jgi:DNA invertase Pin-like site-specific DNA recombinase
LEEKDMQITKVKTLGYARVSHKDQNADRQIIALKEVGIGEEYIFTDKQSGKDFERPMYKEMLSVLDEKSVLYIKSIDRLGRDYNEVIEQWRIITKEIGADIVVIDMPLLDTRNGKDLIGSFLSDIVLQILSFVAENERDNIRKRQSEGIKAAKAKGVRFGRPLIAVPDNFEKCCLKWEQKELTITEAAAECGMARSTFYRKAKELRGK